AVAVFLVVEETGAAGSRVVRYALPLDRGAPDREAVGLLASGRAERLLLVEPPLLRLEEMGIQPDAATVARQSLEQLNEAASRLTEFRTTGRNDWQRGYRLAGLLAEEPDAEVMVLCNRLRSRRWNCVLRAVLPAGAMARVHLMAVVHPDYDETNWWRQ